jgi:hypothetical protein
LAETRKVFMSLARLQRTCRLSGTENVQTFQMRKLCGCTFGRAKIAVHRKPADQPERS